MFNNFIASGQRDKTEIVPDNTTTIHASDKWKTRFNDSDLETTFKYNPKGNFYNTGSYEVLISNDHSYEEVAEYFKMLNETGFFGSYFQACYINILMFNPVYEVGAFFNLDFWYDVTGSFHVDVPPSFPVYPFTYQAGWHDFTTITRLTCYAIVVIGILLTIWKLISETITNIHNYRKYNLFTFRMVNVVEVLLIIFQALFVFNWY